MAERLDGQNKITPAEILRHCATLKSLDRDMVKAAGEVSRIRGEISGVWRAVKAAGGDKEVIKEAMRLMAMEADEADAYQREVFQTAAILGKPMGRAPWVPGTDELPQGALFGGDEDDLTQTAAAELRYQEIKSKGYHARKDRNAPRSENSQENEPGSSDYEAWDAGWRLANDEDFNAGADGSAKGATPKTKKGKAADGEPKRGPGRPKKTQAAPPADAGDPIGETQGNA